MCPIDFWPDEKDRTEQPITELNKNDPCSSVSWSSNTQVNTTSCFLHMPWGEITEYQRLTRNLVKSCHALRTLRSSSSQTSITFHGLTENGRHCLAKEKKKREWSLLSNNYLAINFAPVQMATLATVVHSKCPCRWFVYWMRASVFKKREKGREGNGFGEEEKQIPSENDLSSRRQ